MIYGNAIGGTAPLKTLIIEDENGNVLTGVVTDSVVIFDADPTSDIRAGKKAVTDLGMVVGSAIIPNYETYTGTKAVQKGKLFTIPLPDGHSYTKMQAIICPFNTSTANSVGAEKVVIDNKVFNVQSIEPLSSIVVDFEKNAVDFGITNTTENTCLIRYFMYRVCRAAHVP